MLLKIIVNTCLCHLSNNSTIVKWTKHGNNLLWYDYEHRIMVCICDGENCVDREDLREDKIEIFVWEFLFLNQSINFGEMDEWHDMIRHVYLIMPLIITHLFVSFWGFVSSSSSLTSQQPHTAFKSSLGFSIYICNKIEANQLSFNKILQYSFIMPRM